MQPQPLHGVPAPVLAQVRALNDAVVHWTSPLDAPALDRLLAAAAFAEAVAEEGRVGAFLVGLDQDAAYDSPNFLWLRARLPRFAYVDRVVTAPWAQGQGLARGLYDRFARWAAAQGHDRLACEVSQDNPGSEAFHARLGFRVLGEGEPHPGKAVRYLVRDLGPA